ncbi:ATP-grasp domain-containing protein [Methylobacter sp. YRD-M1]|uniref:ATP-grasp domain-containing protein n=1 Tax=Methylobacter sp. YRD-M1 TaxID=2911520 RepID=UPI00227BDD1E|nr:ATP-grasp domain-containing protein [Methylobacter sp. YRD-M1]WAK03960.1 ATP-grasp domain-containing protein [Methylobacter sp. YRD-M1]
MAADPVIPEYILIIASSARMLTQAAKAAGLKPLVIDRFADQDTQAGAEAYRRVDSLSSTDITAAVEYFIERYGVAHAVYGSGFECCPDSLGYLEDRLTILGNRADAFAGIQHKQTFFACLNELNISCPDVSFSAPMSGKDWLIKPLQGAGGLGIQRWHAEDEPSEAVYWQRHVEGEPRSVLFLADGRNVQVIGFNRQWTVALDDRQAFVFSGIISDSQLPGEHKVQVTDWLRKLVPAFALKGLNSLDFIQAEGQIYVLEVNARPPASMQLYDQDLLYRHVRASQGELIDYPVMQTGCMGCQIVYASADLRIPKVFEWPSWCMDLPESGALIGAKQPICSIIAHAEKSQQVLEALSIRHQIIVNKLH